MKLLHFVSGAMLMVFMGLALVEGPRPADAMGSIDALLRVPSDDYRRNWVQLGSYSVQADDPEDGAKEIHVVYARGADVDIYRQTGRFPDRAVIVKDVFATKSEGLTTGFASYADTLAGRFVMVRDETGKYDGKTPLWGDGWGWAFYEGNERFKTVTTDYKADCLGCHAPAAETDHLYTRGYPVLRQAQP